MGNKIPPGRFYSGWITTAEIKKLDIVMRESKNHPEAQGKVFNWKLKQWVLPKKRAKSATT